MSEKKQSATGSSQRRVLIVDDHPITRRGLAQLINHEKDLCVCGEAPNAHEALKLARSSKPALAIVDITLEGKSGLDLIKDLRVAHPDLLILVLSMHDESLYAERVLRAGARGYIMKQEGGERLMQAIRQVLGGHAYVSDAISGNIVENLAGRRTRLNAPSPELLTDRELEVLQLVGRGLATRRIAQVLHVSARTVESHRAHIKYKLQIKDAAALIRYAVNWVELQKAG